ncbi:hypothetical protein FSARC_10628 [Fusarium sarcochroum]|uniref:Uncharacterized protein n=1 Tax=Fusarium sarcochroum TaxID=1208366 RepID=A0A8H4X2Q4_9HYPO|nr:hypothetical protein FSARC_10628 [Fusarium sarcochroum]
MDDIHQAKATRSPQQIYQLVLEVSNRSTSFLCQLPWFLRLDGDKLRLAELARERPYTTQQRAILLYGIYSRLGRLHRPFVTRGITDPGFLKSYETGIECAENLLTISRMTTQGQLDMFGRSHSFDQHSFNAMILLALDVMAHPNLERSERRRGELIDMCSLLKDKHMQLGQPATGLSRAIELLLEMVQNPKIHQTRGATDKGSHFSSNSVQAKDDKVVAEGDVSLLSEAPFQMSWMDESFQSFCDQDYNILFDNLQENLSDLGHVFWDGSMESEGVT